MLPIQIMIFPALNEHLVMGLFYIVFNTNVKLQLHSPVATSFYQFLWG